METPERIRILRRQFAERTVAAILGVDHTDVVEFARNHDDVPEVPAADLEELIDAFEADLADHMADAAIHSSGRELGYAEITSTFTAPNNGQATLADVTGLEVTVEVGDRPILIEVDLSQVAFSANTATPQPRIYEGSTILKTRPTFRPTANQGDGVNFSVRLNPSPGEHTYKVAVNMAASPSGTVSVVAAAITPSFIRVTEG